MPAILILGLLAGVVRTARRGEAAARRLADRSNLCSSRLAAAEDEGDGRCYSTPCSRYFRKIWLTILLAVAFCDAKNR